MNVWKIAFTAIAVGLAHNAVVWSIRSGWCWRSALAGFACVVCCVAAMRERTKTAN